MDRKIDAPVALRGQMDLGGGLLARVALQEEQDEEKVSRKILFRKEEKKSVGDGEREGRSEVCGVLEEDRGCRYRGSGGGEGGSLLLL